jgi:hypothetical protein
MSLKDDFGNPFDDDSDDEDGASKSKKKKQSKAKDSEAASKDPYKQSLCYKAGRNTNTSLYYVDYTKLKPMDHDQRNDLLTQSALADQEHQALNMSIKENQAQTKRLVSEPTNEELAVKLQEYEEAVAELEATAVEARKLKANEKQKQKVQGNIQTMTRYWRQRKKLTDEFLINIEQATDGAVSRAKCYKGDGQIALDSDEGIVKGKADWMKDKAAKKALAAASKKGKKHLSSKPLSNAMSSSSNLADENFIGVLLNSQGGVKRFYLGDQL